MYNVIDVGVHLVFHLVEIKYYDFGPNGNTFVQTMARMKQRKGKNGTPNEMEYCTSI